ncbi:type III-B CRISPR module-associated Cmr3 family protein [Clostridium botulinum]|uniref:type III-B CRISPR module-associated Cmr3 family protein n=1 Tax=Clostridium botulinum TaxID=1491 RepID=UPI0006AC2CF8|nr:type III-B CRISPR module-associated Cmr3 family protein [Clostridium botulinum]MBD5587502.1 CRISPR-associated protein Cmr3 [Clostridium botulinum]MBY6829950.1 CRISPR-associated protein Cmr3 [Clostridium botulinum]MBY6908474.1 CRISPR-associated protein Cmr3 [Clostridium botulinum]MBY6924422.1 CRISPR-associated protein Cmr3 [Clostridium botulinum]MBY6939659.1 CRISPR-associated protein Cmr3 [Clostridium botulinum]
MSNKYLVRLKPIGSFFFGSERTFGLGKDNENYIIQSEYFPQQTSILGMLRKEILVIKSLIRDDWDYKLIQYRINKLIGKESFNINSNKEQDFGAIKSISPVFIKKGDKYLTSIPKDHKVKKENNTNEKKELNKEYTPFTFKDKCKVNFGNSIKEIYVPDDYVAKDGLSNDFINLNNHKEIIKLSDVFKEDKQIGIKLKKNKTTSNDGLYKIIRYRLEKDYEFAFNVDIEFNDDFQEKDLYEYSNVVNLGGESSYFKINFEKVNNSIEDSFETIKKNSTNNYYKKIILLSNTYINKEEYEQYCDYGIIKGINFRNLRTDYKKLKEKGEYYNKFDKTKKFIFLERGSVLFTVENKLENLEMGLKEKSNLINIGHNKYIKYV